MPAFFLVTSFMMRVRYGTVFDENENGRFQKLILGSFVLRVETNR